MENPGTSTERIETTEDHPEDASEEYKYGESLLNKLELQYAAAEQDYAEKSKAYMDAKESNMKETDADNYNILNEVESKLIKEREKFVNLVRYIADDHPKNASEEYKYDESHFNNLELQCTAAKQDHAEKYKAYMDAKESKMSETDVHILDREQTKALFKCIQVQRELIKEWEFVSLARSITGSPVPPPKY